MKAATQYCNKHGHPEFSVICDEAEIYVPRVKWLLEWLEGEVARGKRFLPEQTVQVGWSLLKVKRRDDGTLGLLEPDFKSMPASFSDNVSITLLHLLLQKSVNESLGLENEMLLSSLQHSAIVCTDFGTTKGVTLSRTNPTGNDSGWFCGCDNGEHDHQSVENLRRISLYEAAVALDDRIIPYLALPAGILISLVGSHPRFFLNDKELSIKPSSYLHKKFVAT
jgi:hypothetical protein